MLALLLFLIGTPVYAMAPQGGEGGGGLVMTLVMFGSIILIMYFLMIRPQQKRQKEHQAMLANLKRGEKVITSSGIHGTIVDIDGSTLKLQVSDNTQLKFEKASVVSKQ